MVEFDDLLRYFGRKGTTELLLETGKGVSAKVDGKLTPVTRELSLQEANRLLTNPEFGGMGDPQGPPSQMRPLTIGGRKCYVTVARKLSNVMIRIAALEPPRPPRPSPRPTN